MIDDKDLLFVPCEQEEDNCDYLHIIDGELVSFPQNTPYKECVLSDYYYIASKKECQ